jgi:response regulator NasT
MDAIRIVNHAKWLLIDPLRFSEQEAHQFIEKRAMDRCMSKRAVAEEIIATYNK